jgi:hypothetical protein
MGADTSAGSCAFAAPGASTAAIRIVARVPWWDRFMVARRSMVVPRSEAPAPNFTGRYAGVAAGGLYGDEPLLSDDEPERSAHRR